MNINNELRTQSKLLKALQGISYTEIAEYLEIPASSFYNWLCNYYDFGTDRQTKLKEILDNLKE